MTTRLAIPPFPTPKDLREAKALQQELARKIVLEGDPSNTRFMAALDASHKRGEALVAVAVLWDLQEDRALEVGVGRIHPDEVFPYVPGFLSFREAPAYLEALAQLAKLPEGLLVDGQGVAHPRGLGVASHLGVHLDLPAIGVAKTRLVGEAPGALEAQAGSRLSLSYKGSQIGWVYRSRANVKPLYLSPGHRVGLEETFDFVRKLPTRTRLPEPLRQAHLWAGRARREGLSGRIMPE